MILSLFEGTNRIYGVKGIRFAVKYTFNAFALSKELILMALLVKQQWQKGSKCKAYSNKFRGSNPRKRYSIFSK